MIAADCHCLFIFCVFAFVWVLGGGRNVVGEGIFDGLKRVIFSAKDSMLESKLLQSFRSCPKMKVFTYTELYDRLVTNQGVGEQTCDFLPVIGQNIAVRIVSSSLSSRLQASQAYRKPLVFFLFGPTGIGKTFLARKIMQNVFFTGFFETEDSTFVRNYLHINCRNVRYAQAHEMMEAIANQIEKCKRSVIIIDEPHLLPDGHVEQLQSFLQHGQPFLLNHRKIDSSNAIFIFTTNEGAELIVYQASELNRMGKRRNLLTQHDFDNVLKLITDAITGSIKNYVDFFVPLLPPLKGDLVKFVETLIREEECRRSVSITYEVNTIENVIDNHVTPYPEYPEFTENGFGSLRTLVFEAVILPKISRELERRHKVKVTVIHLQWNESKGDIECFANSLSTHDEI
eukprot:m.68349 g.68349  ORF g.68349 m.68349 type:complete len:400 (+) comp8243_c0_seq7:38-1237(+)